MGAFYTNLTLLGPKLAAVLDYLNAQKISAYVTQPQPDTVVVFDEQSDTQDDAIITTRAAQLSRQFNCGALAVLNHDGDMLAYWLYENGKQLDQYNSTPGYFSGELTPPAGGDAAALCRVFGADVVEIDALKFVLGPMFRMVFDFTVDDIAAQIARVMSGALGKADPPLYTSATGRHEALCAVLGLPSCTVSYGFTYLSKGDLPDDLSADKLKRSGVQSG